MQKRLNYGFGFFLVWCFGLKEYARGFEDAAELALKAVTEAESLVEARKKILYILGLVKEKKYRAIQDELGVYG